MEDSMRNVDFRDAVFERVYELAKQDENVVFITGDMGAFSLEKYRKEMPERFFNVGIAEQNIINLATGMALAGKIVFVYSIIPFITMRCFEQIKTNIAEMNLPIYIIGGGPGFCYGDDGPTHHGIEDITLMRTLKNFKIYNPCDSFSARACVNAMYENKSPSYIRMEKGCFPQLYDEIGDVNKGYKIFPGGSDILIASTGSISHIAYEVYQDNKKNSSLINFVSLKDINTLDGVDAICDFKLIISVDESCSVGGLGDQIRKIVMDSNACGVVKSLDINYRDDKCEYGDREYLRELYSLNKTEIEMTIRHFIDSKEK